MLLRQIIDPGLAQYAYLIGCRQTNLAIVIDPERDIDRYIGLAKLEGVDIIAVAETHIHADFLSGAREFADRHGARLYLSDEGSDDWKYAWPKASGYDHVLLRDGDTFRIGTVELKAIHTPGHTPEHLSYLVTDRGGGVDEPMGLVTGDFVFVGDFGRPDLLESAASVEEKLKPSARRLYQSAKIFVDMPEYLQVWPAHGAGSACGKSLGAVPQTTVGYELRYSAAVDAVRKGEEAFVDFILEDQPEPPMYFARMKHHNRDGVGLLGALPRPHKLSTDELATSLDRHNTLVLDTRTDQEAFASEHIPGAFHTPMDSLFSSVVGSLVMDEKASLCLIASDAEIEETVRRLVRMGYDNIVGYADEDAMSAHFEAGGSASQIGIVDFEALERHRSESGVAVLDVRYASEFREGHVPGAMNVSYTRLPEREQDVPADRRLLVHCESGIRSTAAASFLARSGRDVEVVLDDWENYAAAHETASEEPAGVA